MADIMLRLGRYSFGLNTAAYQQLARSTEYRWKAQERIQNDDALQFTGRGTDSITLQGLVFPAWRGGAGQANAMRAEAAKGMPLLLVDGRGIVHGRWVIERIEEQQAVFAGAGVPLRQSFTMQIRKFDDGTL